MRRLALLSLLFGASLSAAACGGSGRLSKDEYRSKLKALDAKVSKGEAAVRSAITPTATVAQIRAALNRFADVDKQVGDEVAKLKPPKEAEDANALLARGFRDLATETKGVAAKLSSVKSPAAALALVQRAGTSFQGAKELDQAVSELKKLGLSAGS
jgi:hypothetical protein